MNCFSCERNLSAYIDDELTHDARLEVEAHLDTCEACRKNYETHLAAWEAAGRVRAEGAPEGLWRDIESELQQKGAATTTEDLALIVRGLAEEVRDLKGIMESLRRDLESIRPLEAQEEVLQRDPLRQRLYLWTDPGRQSSAR